MPQFRHQGNAAVLFFACQIFLASALLTLGLLGSATAQTSLSKHSNFPITITKSGSYVLKSNLAPPLNIDAIDITANNVTIDLNGFTISGTPTSANVWAISASTSSGVIVRNGQISGICLRLGQNALVEDIIALNCAVTDSIDVGAGSRVLRSTATGGTLAE